MQDDGGRLAFQETTDRIIQALGIRTGKQRLDSTHIMSNIATLTRLGLFCETMRLFLRALRWEHPELRPGVPEGLLGRYLKEEDEATHYEDARTGEGRRSLSVCARDLYRLVDRFHGTTAAQLEEYRLLERLLLEQCGFAPKVALESKVPTLNQKSSTNIFNGIGLQDFHEVLPSCNSLL